MNEEEKRICQNCKQDFTIEPEDFDFYEKMKVPAPTFCWKCRAQRRFAIRNERALYKRKCDKTGETIFSTYPASAPFPVYKQSEWFGDNWDPMSYGRDYDFNKPFFQQFKELSHSVPKPARSIRDDVNSEYSNNSTHLKNCYLIFDTTACEDSSYGTQVNESKFCFDATSIRACESAYEVFTTFKSNKIFYSSHIIECMDIWFSRNLLGCTNCFGCINLKNKSYYIFNKPHTRQEYMNFMKEFKSGSYKAVTAMNEKTTKFIQDYPRKFAYFGRRTIDSTGEYIYGSTNVLNSYMVTGAKDLKYCQIIDTPLNQDCYDYTIWGENAERIYECSIVGDEVNNVRFSFQSWSGVRDCDYVEYCHNSSNLFGCVSLRNKQNCILNKQYSAEEFKTFRKKIINHMNEMPYIDKGGRIYKYGEFFPIEFSPFGYNETIAQEFFELTKVKAIELGFNWSEIESPQHKATIESHKLPDNVDDIDGSILKEIIGCEHKQQCNQNCTLAYKITPAEFQFYKRFNISIPRLCPNCRHHERINQRNPIEIFDRTCQCAGKQDDHKIYTNIGLSHKSHLDDQHCPNIFKTPYHESRSEIIYCKECYNGEFV